MPKITGYITHAFVNRPVLFRRMPEAPERIEAIESRMLVAGLREKVLLIQAPAASRADVTLAHDVDYVQALEAVSSGSATSEQKKRFVAQDSPVGTRTYVSAMHSVGAVIRAVNAIATHKIRNAFCAIRPPGHHAGRAHSHGFCFFNNVAIGALYAQKHGFERVAIIDFDVHHGDGTEEIIAGKKGIHFWSMFQWPLFPHSKMRPCPDNVTQSPLRAGTDGLAVRSLLEEVWIPQLRAFRPDIIFLSAGFDAHTEEHLAQCKLEETDFIYMTRRLAQEAAQLCNGYLVSVLEGGYSLSSLARSALSHIHTLVRAAEHIHRTLPTRKHT